MADQPQSSSAGKRKDIAKPLGWSTGFVAADTECDRSLMAPRYGEFGDAHPRLCSEMPHRVENPKCSYWRPLGLFPDSVIYGRQILLLPQDHAGRERDLGIGDVLRGQPSQQVPGGERVVFGGLQALRDPNVAAKEFVECLAVKVGLNLIARNRWIDLHQRFGFNGPFQMD